MFIAAIGTIGAAIAHFMSGDAHLCGRGSVGHVGRWTLVLLGPTLEAFWCRLVRVVTTVIHLVAHLSLRHTVAIVAAKLFLW